MTLNDPTNGQPFPNNFIPPTASARPRSALAKLIPVATNPCGQIVYAIPNPNNENQDVVRADWLQSPENSIFGRFFVADYDNPPYLHQQHSHHDPVRPGRARHFSRCRRDQYTTPGLVNALHLTYTRLINNRAVSRQMPNLVSLGRQYVQRLSALHRSDASPTSSRSAAVRTLRQHSCVTLSRSPTTWT